MNSLTQFGRDRRSGAILSTLLCVEGDTLALGGGVERGCREGGGEGNACCSVACRVPNEGIYMRSLLPITNRLKPRIQSNSIPITRNKMQDKVKLERKYLDYI